MPRPLTDRGKGSYWTVNDNVDPRTGVHRVRKKKSKSSKQARSSEEADGDFHAPQGSNFADPNAPYTSMNPDEAGPSRQQQQAVPYPPPYPPPYVCCQSSELNLSNMSDLACRTTLIRIL